MFEDAFARQFNDQNGFASKNDIAVLTQQLGNKTERGELE
jgi:hypothetical protein